MLPLFFLVCMQLSPPPPPPPRDPFCSFSNQVSTFARLFMSRSFLVWQTRGWFFHRREKEIFVWSFDACRFPFLLQTFSHYIYWYIQCVEGRQTYRISSRRKRVGETGERVWGRRDHTGSDYTIRFENACSEVTLSEVADWLHGTCWVASEQPRNETGNVDFRTKHIHIQYKNQTHIYNTVTIHTHTIHERNTHTIQERNNIIKQQTEQAAQYFIKCALAVSQAQGRSYKRGP